MRRGLFILAVLLLTVSGQDAHAARFGTQDSYQHLQDLKERGPKGEALSLGYVTTTHSFILPYKMTGNYVLVAKGAGRDLSGRPVGISQTLSQDKIEQMQRTGALPKPLPPYRHTIFDYLWAYILWWCIPVTFAFVALFQMFGIGSRKRGENRSTRNL
jgi:hypothetical protein